MPDASLSIKIGADVSSAVSGFQKASDASNDLGTNIAQLSAKIDQLKDKRLFTSNADDVARLNQEIATAQAGIDRISNIGKAGFDEFGEAIQKIPQELSSIGVGSNGLLNTLSKQRIAFQDVGRAITGQGFSLRSLSSNFALFGPEVVIAAGAIGLLIEQLFKQSDAEKKAAEDAEALQETLQNLKSVNDVIDVSSGSQAGDIAKVNALAAAVRNVNLSYVERQRALQQLQETNKNYFGDLTLEADSLATLSKRVQDYSQALIQEAVVKGFVDEIAKTTEEYNKQKDTLDKLHNTLDQTRDAYAAAAKEYTKNNANNNPFSNKTDLSLSNASDAINKANAAFLKQRDAVEQLSVQIGSYNGKLNDAVATQLKLKPLDDTTGKTVDSLQIELTLLEQIKAAQESLNKTDNTPNFKKENLSIDTEGKDDIAVLQAKITKAIQEGAKAGTANARNYAQQLAALYQEQIDKIQFPNLSDHINFSLVDPSADGDLEKTIDKIKEGIQKHLEDLKEVDVKVPVYIEDAVKDDSSLTDEQKRIILEKIKEDAGKGIPTILLPIPIKAQFKAVIDAAEAKKALQDINNAIDSSITGGLTNLGESIGSAIAKGKNPIEAAGDAIVSSLGEMIEKIGEALVKFGAIKLGLDAILKNPILIPGGVAIAIGIGAIAVGALLKSVANSGKGFASGGPISGPGGPTSDSILARLSNGEFVVKAAAVRQPGNLALLNAINEGQTPAFASGGFVGPDLSFPNSPLNSFVQNNVISFDKIPVEITGKSKIEGNHIIIAHTRATKNQNLVS